MSFPYKNPISSIQVNGTQSVPRNNTYGTTFSVNNTGGYMEVFSLSDLYYTIPSGTTGSIEYSGNTIPIEFTKGTGNVWSPDVITLASDNISSGRRRLGMLVYVYEEDQVYQYYINNYETLFNAATASTGCVRISDFGTTINNKTAAGQLFINAWTGNTIEDVSGATYSTAVWRKFSSGASSGGTSGTSLYIVGAGVNSTVRCGVNNTAKGDYGASLGGSGNTASGNYSFVGGGGGNTASGVYSFVGGGTSNTSSGNYSFVGGGGSNTASNYFSTIGGGGFHTSSGFYSTISGGRCNTSSNYNTTVSGGYCNTSSSKYSTVGGGFKNNSTGLNSTVGGGVGNTASGNYSTVAGGSTNIASGTTSTISGGYNNTLSGSYSFIGGGTLNTSSGYYSFIGGGTQNTISGYPSFGPSFSTILNGCLNTISGTSKIGSYSVIIGGCNNVISNTFIGVFGSNIVASCPNTFYTNDFCSCGSIYSSTLSSGQAVCSSTNGLLTNYTPVSPVIIQGSCITSSVRCGVSNSATESFSAALAGTGNTASGGASVIAGGAINNTYSVYSFVGGGVGNKSCGSSTSVVGGSLNTACCATSFIGGGQQNITSGVTSSVVGGFCNTAGGNCSFIGGGNLNTITSGGTFSFIGSGRGNNVSGSYGMVLGGSGNTVTGSFSSAIGCGLNASANCTLYTNNIITGGFSATTISASTVTTSFTTGSVIFQGSGGALSQNNSNFFWDNTNTGLVLGGGSLDSNYILQVNGTKGIRISGTGTGFGYSLVRGTESAAFTNNGSAGSFVSTTNLLFLTGVSERMRINSSGNVLIGTTTDAGFKLDVNGTARVSGNAFFTIGVRVGTSLAGIFPTGTSGRESVVVRSTLFPTDIGEDIILSNAQGDAANTSGTRTIVDIQRGFNPTSGTGVYNALSITAPINQTGGANGITRGLYINPTLTSAANFRAIEVANGRVVISDTSTVTGTNATSLLDLSQTWNTTGAPNAFSLNVTDTASGGASALFRLRVGNNTTFSIAKDGYITFAGVAGGSFISPSTPTTGAILVRGESITIGHNITTGAGYGVWLRRNSGNRTATSGDSGQLRIFETFAPTSGTGTYNTILIDSTINQTGGASGITRGIYVSPTLTSAADFRAIEVERGKVILNSISGNTLIGTTADTGTYKLDVRGLTRFSAATGTSLTVISSGNSTSAPVFSVQGSQGELFSVTDSLTGSLFSVSDISGLPILEVFSDSTTIIGDYQAPSLYTTKRVSSITATTGTTIYSFPTSAYTSSFVDYFVSGSTGLRAGNMMAIWSGSTVNFTETSTNDIGVTTPVTFGYVMSGSSAVLRASASTGTWIVESILRGL
jgi:hypothetical protein